jgi:Raf kinase inhibitor-like YbhB/YbcL family protein
MLERPDSPNPYDLLPSVPSFELTSSDVQAGTTLSNDHVAQMAGGDDVSPQLSWSGFPSETQGFVVTCYDPDAPTGSGFWHWALVGLGADVTELARGAGDPSGKNLPSGAFQLKNDAGQQGYTGAAPPEGDKPHRYIFAVHALDTDKLDVEPSNSPAWLGFNMTFHVIARATLTANYQR